MSLVYITHHNENIYDYEEKGLVSEPIPRKPLKYVSKHKALVKKKIHQSYITEDPNGMKLITDWGKHERRTMGCAHTPLDPPKCFLRKNQGLKWRRLHDHVCPPSKGLDPVPPRSQMPKKPCRPQKGTQRSNQGKQDENSIGTERSVKAQGKETKPGNLIATDRSGKSTKSVEENDPKQQKLETLDDQMDPCETCGTAREREKQEKLKNLVNPCCTTERSVKSEKVCLEAEGQENTLKLEKLSKTDEVKSNKTPKSKQTDRRCKSTNFIALNKKRAIEAKTKRPPPHFVDTPYGSRQNLLNSGLIPQFVCGRNFAKVPCYINEHKKMLQKFRAACGQEDAAVDRCNKEMTQRGIRKMSIEERMSLLEGLKANYFQKLKMYQTLSLYTDTPTKKLRKSRLEKSLQELEVDIHFLEDNRDIFLADF